MSQPEKSLFEQFMEQTAQLGSSEEKLACGISFLRRMLSQNKVPRFKEFWGIRKLCLDFFKSDLNSVVRAKCWSEYIELTTEAKRLKDILNEQSIFLAEQIDLALSQVEGAIQKLPFEWKEGAAFIQHSKFFAEKEAFYSSLQAPLSFLNIQAMRLSDLRKEVLKIDLRIIHKFKLFDRLAEIGDRVFPKRKALTEEVSTHFLSDIKRFVAEHFPLSSPLKTPFYLLREEIRGMQAIAKLLSVNPSAFMQTRLLLSECWDELKEKDKERKKQIAEKKQLWDANLRSAEEKIEKFKLFCEQSDSLFKEVKLEQGRVLSFLRSLELNPEDGKKLHEKLHALAAPFKERQQKEENERKGRIQKQEEELQCEIAAIEAELQTLIENREQHDLEEMEKSEECLLLRLKSLPRRIAERQSILISFSKLNEIKIDKRQARAIKNCSSDGDRLIKLKEVYAERKKRHSEIKAKIDTYRKELGQSGLNFDRAFTLRQMLDSQKRDLEKSKQAIDEIEIKIRELISHDG
jgi:hypothetical protein